MRGVIAKGIFLGVLVYASTVECGDEISEKVTVQHAAEILYAPIVELTGSIEPANSTELAFKIGGRIEERLVDVGDILVEGDVVARLDATGQQALLVAAQAAVDAAKGQLNQAQVNHRRLLSLWQSGTTTRINVDQAYEALQIAQGSLDAARAEFAVARDNVASASLISPVSGVVSARHAETGQIVQTAQPIFTVAEDGGRDAVFDIDEAALLKMPANPEISLHSISNDKTIYAGIVREIAQTVDPQMGTIRIKVSVTGGKDLPLGSTVIGSAALQPQKAMVFAVSALTLGPKGASVWAVGQDNRLELKPVEVLNYEDDRIAISSGLSPGDAVVVLGPRAMRVGMAVTPVEADT